MQTQGTNAGKLGLKGCMDAALHVFDTQTRILRCPCVACPHLHATCPNSSAEAGWYLRTQLSHRASCSPQLAAHPPGLGTSCWSFWMECHRVCHRGEIHLLTSLAVLYRKRCQAAVRKAHTPLQRSRGGSHRLRQRRSYTVPDHWSPFGRVNNALLRVLRLVAGS